MFLALVAAGAYMHSHKRMHVDTRTAGADLTDQVWLLSSLSWKKNAAMWLNLHDALQI